jgi:hypothetical protein
MNAKHKSLGKPSRAREMTHYFSLEVQLLANILIPVVESL